MRSATTTSSTQRSTRTTPVQIVAALVAMTFLAVGAAGFIPGLTTNVDQLEFYGRHDNLAAQPELLGLFHVSVLHNLVHLAFGVGLLMARTVRGAKAFLIGGGITYAGVLAYGLVIDMDSEANFLPLNTADNWLHAGLAAAMIGLGLMLGKRTRPAPDASGL